jgi:hypothetical protein
MDLQSFFFSFFAFTGEISPKKEVKKRKLKMN